MSALGFGTVIFRTSIQFQNLNIWIILFKHELFKYILFLYAIVKI